MNEFDKEKAIEKDIKAVENRIRHAYNQGYEAGLKHGKEQDTVPFDLELYQAGLMDMPKEMIEVLDEIQAEIRHFMYDINPSSSESDYACNYILQIIDKYRK